MNRPLLFIDGLNLFSRIYYSNQGYSVINFITSICKYIELINPKGLYISWECGFSSVRKEISSEYKNNRVISKDINKTNKIIKLTKILKHTPACQIYIEDCESDDVISYLCLNSFEKNIKKIILSSDKDYYQIINDDIIIYCPQIKGFLDKKEIVNRYGLLPSNFPIYKAICGDPSDNISGIPTIGKTKFMKIFGDRILNNDINSYDEIYEICKISKYGNRILDNFEFFKLNMKIICLKNSLLNENQVNKINNVILSHKSKIDYKSLTDILVRNNLGFLFSNIVSTMTRLE